MRTPLLFISLSLSLSVYGQNDSEATYLEKKATIEISAAGKSIKIKEHFATQKLFTSNIGKHSSEDVYYSDFDPILELNAETLVPYKSGFRRNEVSAIGTEDIVQSGVFYGDVKRKQFVYPALTEGAIGKLEYTKLIKHPELLSPFFFDEAIPVKKSEFTVTFPTSVSVKYKLFGSGVEKIIMDHKTHQGNTTYRWTLSDVPAYHQDTDAPSRSYFAPHIVVYIESFTTSAGQQNVLADVSDLYRWYGSHIRQIPATDNSELKRFVADLTKSSVSDKDKTKIIFQWVQQHIRYIAFEDGMAGFIPRSSADVYTKRYGDCKDMANLLKDMLDFAGVEAYHTWIGTRKKSYSYQQVPTSINNNHMICSTKIDGEYIFLDATNPFVNFGDPSSMIQSKEALIGITPDKYEVVRVPEVSKSKNQRVDTLRIELQPNGVKGQFISSLTGFRKDDLDVAHLRATIKNDKEYIRDFFSVGGNNIQTDHLSIKGLNNANVPSQVSFDFSQPGYIKTINDRIYINMHLYKPQEGEKLEANREQLLEKEYHYEDRLVSILNIPEGYKVAFVPVNSSKTGDHYGITVNYRVEGKTIILERTIHSGFLYLNKTQFASWNAYIESLNNIFQQSITLTKTN